MALIDRPKNKQEYPTSMSFWLKRALARATTRQAPDRIPLSAPRVYDRDYYSVTLAARDDSWSFLFVRLEGDTVFGRRWDGERYANEIVDLPLRHFIGEKVEFRYYLRQHEFISTSVVRFELAGILGLYRIRVKLGDFAQIAYNRKSLVLRQRIDLLKILINETIEDSERVFNASSIVVQLYGRAVTGHPDFRNRLHYFTLLLNSLVAAGLLSQDGIAYRLQPDALTALDAYEDEERRHEDSVKVQRWVMFLTFFSSVGAIAQASGPLKDWGTAIFSWLANFF